MPSYRSIHSYFTFGQSFIFFPSNLISTFSSLEKLIHFQCQTYNSLFDIVDFLSRVTKDLSQDNSFKDIQERKTLQKNASTSQIDTKILKSDSISNLNRHKDFESPSTQKKELTRDSSKREISKEGFENDSKLFIKNDSLKNSNHDTEKRCERVIIFLSPSYSNFKDGSYEQDTNKLSILKDFYTQIDKLMITSILFIHLTNGENETQGKKTIENTKDDKSHVQFMKSAFSSFRPKNMNNNSLVSNNSIPRSQFILHLPLGIIPYFESVIHGLDVVSYGVGVDDRSSYITIQQVIYAVNQLLKRVINPPSSPELFSDSNQGNFYFENPRAGPYIYGVDLLNDNLHTYVHNRENVLEITCHIDTHLSKSSGKNLTHHLFLYGYSGTGKRTLCNAIARSREIRNTFAREGGIFQMSLSHSSFGSNILTTQSMLITHLQIHQQNTFQDEDLDPKISRVFSNIRDAKFFINKQFQKLKSNQRTLLILHDVSTMDELKAFIFQDCPNLFVLFTSNNVKLGKSLAASNTLNSLKDLVSLDMKKLSSENIVSLISLHTGIPCSILPRSFCDEVALFCKYHPLTLSILSGHLKSALTHQTLKPDEIHIQWREEFSALRSFGLSSMFKSNILSYVSQFEGGIDKAQFSNMYSFYLNIFQVISFIIHDLDYESRIAYQPLLQCVVFMPNDKIPLQILKILWEQYGVNSTDFFNVLQKLNNLSLINIHSFETNFPIVNHKPVEEEVPDSSPSQITNLPIESNIEEPQKLKSRNTFVSIHPLVSHFLHSLSHIRSQERRKKDPSLPSDVDLVQWHMKMLEIFARISKSDA